MSVDTLVCANRCSRPHGRRCACEQVLTPARTTLRATCASRRAGRRGWVRESPALDVRVLGPFEVLRRRGVVDVGGPQQRAVLAHLALARGRVVPVDRLIARLWGDEPPASAPRHPPELHLPPPRRARTGPAAGAPATGPGVGGARATCCASSATPSTCSASSRWPTRARRRCTATSTPPPSPLRRGPGPVAGPALGRSGGEVSRRGGHRPPRGGADRRRRGPLRRRAGPRPPRRRHRSAPGGGGRAAAARAPLGPAGPGPVPAGRQADAVRALATARTTLGEELGLVPGPELQRLELQILNHDPARSGRRRRHRRAPPPREHRHRRRRQPRPRRRRPRRPPAPSSAASSEQPRSWPPWTPSAAGAAVILARRRRGRHRQDGHPRRRRPARPTPAAGPCCGGAASKPGMAPPLWPWVEVLRALAAATPGQRRSRSARRSPSWRMPSGSAAPAAEPRRGGRRRRRLRAGRRRARRSLIVLDDLHWADAPSLDLLGLVDPAARRCPVVVAVGHRPADLATSPALAATLAAVARGAERARLDLGGLDPDDVGRAARRRRRAGAERRRHRPRCTSAAAATRCSSPSSPG